MASRHKLHLSLFVLYIIGVTAFMVWEGVGITPDRYALLLIFAALIIGRSRDFLLNWLPFLSILISYDFFRSFADNLNPRTHYLEMINLDKFLFGQVPTVTLQHQFFSAGVLHWYDYLATVLYFLHFALPLGFAFLLWLKDKKYFRQFITGLLILSYAAYATYIIFPASPPWLSAQSGLLPGVTKIMDNTIQSFPQRLNLPTLYYKFDPNLVAAVPSLHAAYPLLVLLFSLSFFGVRALLFLPYVLAVWISIIYLGEHYAVDVLLGIIYAALAFIASQKILVTTSTLFKKLIFTLLPSFASKKH